MEDNIINEAIITLGKSGIVPSLNGGKVCFGTNQKPGGPWVYIKYSKHNCTMLRTFIHQLISKRLPLKERFIPSECQKCYKVVIRPESYDDLLKLYPIMKELDFASKLGIEKRESVDSLYGAYFYCNSLKEGLDRLDTVNFALTGTNMKAFLKRGCTEYESEFGPSNTWEVKTGQYAIEKEVFDRVEIDNSKRKQTETDIFNIMESWKEFAEALGPVYKGTHNYITYGEDKKCQKQTG
jgi:hypothetical protein